LPKCDQQTGLGYCYSDYIRTCPSFKHVVDEKLNEARLGLWNVTHTAVEHWHDDR